MFHRPLASWDRPNIHHKGIPYFSPCQTFIKATSIKATESHLQDRQAYILELHPCSDVYMPQRSGKALPIKAANPSSAQTRPLF
jgi:hypothetical protein